MKHLSKICAGLLLTASAALAQTPLTFTQLGTLPDGGRYGMGYCQDASFFYMMGGGSPSTAFNSNIYVYIPSGNSWVMGAASSSLVPQRWASLAPAASGSTGTPRLFVLNGANAAGAPITDMQTVSTANGTINPTFSNPLPTSSAAVAVWNNSIYAFGGQLANGSYGNQLRAYNATTDTWTTLAPMPEAKAVYGGAAVNGKIYAIGGYNGVSNSARVDAYDIATNTWQAQGTLPTTLSNQAVAVQGEWLWLVGDFTNQGYLAAYNTRTRQLRTFTSNLPPRRNAAAAFLNNQLYVWGGNTASSNASTLADMWVVNVSSVLATSPATAPAAVLRAYPNPCATGLATLSLPEGTRRVEVLDALGRQIEAETLPAGASTWPLRLDARPAGVYLVRALTSQGSSVSCRVVRE